MSELNFKYVNVSLKFMCDLVSDIYLRFNIWKLNCAIHRSMRKMVLRFLEISYSAKTFQDDCKRCCTSDYANKEQHCMLNNLPMEAEA